MMANPNLWNNLDYATLVAQNKQYKTAGIDQLWLYKNCNGDFLLVKVIHAKPPRTTDKREFELLSDERAKTYYDEMPDQKLAWDVALVTRGTSTFNTERSGDTKAGSYF